MNVEIEERETKDKGVETLLHVEEDGTHHGEKYHRETELRLLEDGGVDVTQRIQGCYDQLTLSSEMVDAINEWGGAE